MGVGDEILAAGQAERWYRDTGQPSVIVDRHGRPRWHPIWDRNPAILAVTHVQPDHHTICSAPHCRPYIVYPFTEQTGWTFNRDFRARDHRARIYLTREELQLGAATRAAYGPYILIEPWSKHVNLRWPWEHWVTLVAALTRRKYEVIQHTHRDCQTPVPGATPIPTTSFREACGLVASASVYIRGESGMCHAAAALGVNQVTIWGGCMDWDVLGGYERQIGVGVTPPACGSWKPCGHCAQTMAGIGVDEVLRALATFGVE